MFVENERDKRFPQKIRVRNKRQTRLLGFLLLRTGFLGELPQRVGGETESLPRRTALFRRHC